MQQLAQVENDITALVQARSLRAIAVALLVSLPCHRRMDFVHANIIKHATAEKGLGMGKCVSHPAARSFR